MRIFIIIVNWNGKDDTVLCLRSLQSAGIALSNIILTDNGSTDKSAETVTGLFPEVHLVRNKENLGYAGGNNSGIKYALAMGAEAVVLLNNDTEVDPGFLPPLLAAFYEGETVGIAGSKIYFYDRTDLVWFGSPVLNTTTGRTYDTEYGRRDFSGRAIREVPFISGCAFAVKRDVIDKIGLLDERFFCYAEELDWCQRARAAGFKVVLVPESRVYHKGAASTGSGNLGTTMYYRVRNHLLFVNKNFPLNLRLVTHLRNLLIIGVHTATIFRLKMKKGQAFSYLYKGVRDYYSGKFGKMPAEPSGKGKND